MRRAAPVRNLSSGRGILQAVPTDPQNESARYNLAHPFRTTAASYPCSCTGAKEPGQQWSRAKGGALWSVQLIRSERLQEQPEPQHESS